MANPRFFVLPLLAFIIIVAGVLYGKVWLHQSEESVQGIYLSVLTPTPSASPSLTPTPMRPVFQAIPQPKQYGGWYWQQALGRAQRWLGTDGQGNDIWTDAAVTTTPTPTQQSSSASQNTSQALQEPAQSENNLNTPSPGVGVAVYQEVKVTKRN